ncbi:hydrogen peroxide-inducible genes activator [Marinoscillum sp. MHG1-6]|uniref:hydrogen peroxide-inducible genes activator n=1 Tax=Marinoscillum sp. MHG1-6 TaxID=2959627 RepID=UPI0021577351|nr:hydrogen peroxide-inducible genes activator [Marinoscillum sp. MHG1-6]
MTFAQLEYALAIQKYGSFSKSAQKLSLSQPALSSQIQKLENEIGIRLFDRSSNPIIATEDGHQFLVRAEEIITSTHKLKDFSQHLSSDYSGELRVGIIPTLSPFLVPLFSQSLSLDYPNYKLDITELITQKVIQQVRSGDLDVGIISTPIQAHGILSDPLFYEKFYFYSSTDLDGAILNVNDINHEDLWLLEEGNCFRDQVNDFCKIKGLRESKPVVYRCNSIDSLIRMVDNHGGYTILPELTTISLTEDQASNIRPIERKAREIGLITRTIPDKERYIKVLKTYIQQNVPKHMLSKENLEVVDPGLEVS